MSNVKILLAICLLPSVALSAPLNDFGFKSPAFSGVGYSSHVLTIENQEATRRKANEDKAQAALEKLKSDAANTNASKFLSNLESRIYAQISQNLAAAMFATGGATSGTFVMSRDLNGNPETSMSWTRLSSGDISMTVTQPGQPPTTITVPIGDWQF